MHRITDKKAILLALNMAIDYENAYIDSYGHIPDNDDHKIEATGRAQRNVDAFKRVREKYFGIPVEDGKKPGKTVSVKTLLRSLDKQETL